MGGKSYVDGITVPPTPFPSRLNVPTRINDTWMPTPTTPKSPRSQKTNTPGRSSMKRPVPPALPTSARTGAVVFPSSKQECPSVEASIGPGSRHQWRTRAVTYRVTKYPVGNSNKNVDAVLRQAFDIWEQAADISFRRQNEGNVDVEIRFDMVNGDVSLLTARRACGHVTMEDLAKLNHPDLAGTFT